MTGMHAMTGPWLIVKWVGVSIAGLYLVLLVLVMIRIRRDLSRLRPWLIWAPVMGVFISDSVASVFESVTTARVCFIVASIVYVGGITILLKGLAQKDHQALLKAER